MQILNNQPCTNTLTLADLNPDDHSQGLHHYLFLINLHRCNESCNTPDDPSCRKCVRNKTEDVNTNGIDMITGINESKTLIKHLSYESKSKFDGM